jgi:hypothetical protein
VGSCRRELLDDVIRSTKGTCDGWSGNTSPTFSKTAIHDALGKDTPHRRPVAKKPNPEATVISADTPVVYDRMLNNWLTGTDLRRGLRLRLESRLSATLDAACRLALA